MSRVSVVIPCFELGSYIEEAVASVRAQTRPADELVVVDDGSTDSETLDALDRLRSKGVRVLRQENAGASAARNAGIAATDSDLVLCLDADDLLLPKYLERTVDALESTPAAGIAATRVEMFGTVRGKWRPPAYSVPGLLAKNCIPSASLFRRVCWEEAGGYSDLPACQDWDLWLAMVGHGWEWTVVDEVLYRYRRRSGSISDDRDARRAEIMRQLLNRHARLYEEHWRDVFVNLDADLELWRNRAAKLQTQRREDTEGASAFRGVLTELPDDARVLVVSHGDDALLAVDGVRASHFPQTAGGEYAGHHPADSEHAIAQLEESRARGCEYFALPAPALWWLDHYEGLRAHLEARYPCVHHDETGAVYDITDYRTFSVVICTHRRADLLADSVRSVFAQEYPRDRVELIIVDNKSPDHTADVIDALRREAPIAFSALVEEKLGLSFARNAGIAAAGHEFVAFLDDDAEASPLWLRWFNRLINEERALVVGGRVEKRFPEGFDVPDWFEVQYLMHHFGVNYRDRGRDDPVIRIRQPLYLTGANIAYARRLFDHFGGFRTELGRAGGGLLACEETYMNILLERHGVPLFYSDDAYVHHFVDAWRVEKRHLRSKSYWSGVSHAVTHVMAHGYAKAREHRRSAERELLTLGKEILREPASRERFARTCRLLYNVGYIGRFTKLDVMRRLRRPLEAKDNVTWGIAEWRAEVERWPDSAAKFRQLRELHLLLDDADAAARADDRASELAESVPSAEHELWGPLEELRYERLLSDVAATVETATPPGAPVGVVTRGDPRLLDIPGREAWHFPLDESGVYAGYHPADAAEALAAVERTKRRGIEYLVFPRTAWWWLEHYEGLRDELERRYSRISADDDLSCVIYAIADPSAPSASSAATLSRP